ncbi:hypothetical protein [Thermotoga sp. SG1]|nr:hypothetical protein [Thermotoga sp. SG1]
MVQKRKKGCTKKYPSPFKVVLLLLRVVVVAVAALDVASLLLPRLPF